MFPNASGDSWTPWRLKHNALALVLNPADKLI